MILFGDSFRYLQVLRDINAWEPKAEEREGCLSVEVKPGGFLSGHDFGNHPDVARAVLERAAEFNRRGICSEL